MFEWISIVGGGILWGSHFRGLFYGSIQPAMFVLGLGVDPDVESWPACVSTCMLGYSLYLTRCLITVFRFTVRWRFDPVPRAGRREMILTALYARVRSYVTMGYS